MIPKGMYVYIMGNNKPVLYIGVTSNLQNRVAQHKQNLVEGYTKRYSLHKLLYYEVVSGQIEAIVREKQIKDMNRVDKLEMISKFNPEFKDLYDTLF